MPHVLIFGPLSVGRFGFFILYHKQMSCHLEMISCHIRRNDQVGRTFLSNLNAYEVVIGSSENLFTLAPWNYHYGDKSLTIFFLWRMCVIWKINIEFTRLTTNKPRCMHKNRSIMDNAVAGPEFSINGKSLEAINACQHFHGVVFPSDMLHYNGRYMQNEYMWGKVCMRKEFQEDWPTQPIPVAEQWTIWRCFIRKKYLNQNGEYG